MDVHVPYAVTVHLRSRGVDVITVQDDGATEREDSALLDRASTLGRVLVTQDEDSLREASRRHRSSVPFAGLIYAHQLTVTIGELVGDLELIAHVHDPNEWVSRLQYLPLR